MKKRLFFFLIFSTFFSYSVFCAEEKGSVDLPHKTICLNMIVKDESKVMERCLASVKKIIDYWVIVDTGSTDGTQKIIKEFMKDIPGELHERPWVNFGYNRNEALQLAKNKGDYLLFIDADEYLVYEKDFKVPILDKDLYLILVRNKGFDIKRYCLINNHLDWRWVGAIHEYLECKQTFRSDLLSNVINYTMYDGHRSEDPKKYYKDAMLLEKALKDEPNNSRYVFYLAQVYESAKMYPEALKNYEKRTGMDGNQEEIFCSLYGMGRLQEILKMQKDVIIKSYSKAFVFNPSRAEPLYQLGKYYNEIGNYCLAYLVLKNALTIQLPQESIFVDNWIYDYGIVFELSNTLYFLNYYKQAYSGYLQVLANPNLSDEIKKAANNNLLLTRSKIYPPRFEGMFEEYSNKRLELIAKFIPEDPVVVEAEANSKEDAAKFLNAWPKAKIISFEINLEDFEKMEKKERLGTLLDDWCKEKKVDHLDFMCLNLEGMELFALQSSSMILNTVKVIYTKTNFQEFRKGTVQYADLKAFLEKSGFKLLSHWYEENFQGEAIFVKKEIYDAKINEIKK